MKLKRISCAIFLSALFAQFAEAQKSLPASALKPGETMFYLVHLKTDRNIKTKSALSLPEMPNEASIDVRGILQVEVVSGHGNIPPGGVGLRTWFLSLVSDIGALQKGKKPGQTQEEPAAADDKIVDCVLQADGQIVPLAGLEQLAPEQQAAWREWAARFAGVFLLESETRKRGEKWNGVEPETSPSPIAELQWQKKSQYVKDELCAPLKYNRGEFQRSASQESCAVILTTSVLVQKSSVQDATPPDYKVKGLRTRGTAKGNNETILYISRKTGRLIRATQEAKQQMDVLIVLTNGSSQVHYGVNANENGTVELITELPLILQPKSDN
jgi:hypothetical protein